MRDGAYLKRLAGDLERWRGAGLVTAEQIATMIDDARARANVARSSPAAVAAALGAILFGLGLITFIAANWGAMAKSARMLSALVLIWLTFGGVIVALERKAAWIGHAFALAGALAIGASISLIGQTYHIEGTPAGLFLLWSLGAGATAIAFRSIPVLILFVILAFCWYVFDRPETGFLSGVFGDGRAAPNWKSFGLFYLPLWAVGAFLGRRWDSGAAMHLSGLALALWLVALLADALWRGSEPNWTLVGFLLAGAGATIAALGEYARARLDERAGAIALAWGAAIVFAGLAIAQFSVWDDEGLGAKMTFAALSLVLCAWAINWGETPGRRAVRALAAAGFAFECFYVYTALFEGLLDTSLFLLGGGALLFALAFALRWMTKKKPAAPAPTEEAAP